MIERMKPSSFILCGSSTRKLRATGANFLGGRAWRYLFTPLVFPELTKFDLLHIFQTGLLPTHYLNPQEAKRSIKSYVNDYLLQELQQEGSVRNLRVKGVFEVFRNHGVYTWRNHKLCKYST